MTEAEYRKFYYEVYHLPGQIARAREKLARLEAKALTYGMHELLEEPHKAGAAFELEAVKALASNLECER